MDAMKTNGKYREVFGYFNYKFEFLSLQLSDRDIKESFAKDFIRFA